MANQNSKNRNNNQKKKTNNGKANSNAKNNTNKSKVNANTNSKKVVANKEVKKVTTDEVKRVEAKKEKKKSGLTSKQKDIILVALVIVLLIVALLVSGGKTPKLDIELPVVLQGESGFTEITYSEYEEKIDSDEPFVVIVVRDGCHYCELYEPVVNEVVEEYNIPFYNINLTNLSEDEYNKLGTSNSYLKNKEWGTPTTLFMKGKNVIDSIGGYVEKDELVNFVKKNFKVENNEN